MTHARDRSTHEQLAASESGSQRARQQLVEQFVGHGHGAGRLSFEGSKRSSAAAVGVAWLDVGMRGRQALLPVAIGRWIVSRSVKVIA
jgi:hypothetical protein